jgi:uncharacterized membrane protein YfcA
VTLPVLLFTGLPPHLVLGTNKAQSLWGSGAQPTVSTLNSPDGTVVANAAIVPAGVGGVVTAFTSHLSHLILDLNGYFQ